MNPTSSDPATITFQLDAVTGTEEVHVALDDTAGVLIVTRGPNAGARYVLDTPLMTAGRHPDSDIFLDDVTVSRNHVELTHQAGGAIHVHDVGSLNGTYVNRERIEDADLHNGDELQIGKFKLVYLEADHRTPTSSGAGGAG